MDIKKSLLVASGALILTSLGTATDLNTLDAFSNITVKADTINTPNANIPWSNWQKNASFSLSNNWYSSDSAFTKNADGTYSVNFKNQPQFSVVSQGDTIGTIGMTRISVAIIDATDGSASINKLTNDVTISDNNGHSYTAPGTLVAGKNPYQFKDSDGKWHTVTRHIVYVDVPSSQLTNFTYSTLGAAQFNIGFSAVMNSIPNYPTDWIRYGDQTSTTPTLNGDGTPATANQTATEISTDSVNTLPQVTKVYYKDETTGEEIAPSDILGKGGTTGTAVSAKPKDLSASGYHLTKNEYLTDKGVDTFFSTSQYDTKLTNDKQAVVYWYTRNQGTADVKYIDDTTDKTLSMKDLSGNTGEKADYDTADSIKSYEDQGYKLVSDNYPKDGVTFTDNAQHYEVHLTHDVTNTSDQFTDKNSYIHIKYIFKGQIVKMDLLYGQYGETIYHDIELAKNFLPDYTFSHTNWTGNLKIVNKHPKNYQFKVILTNHPSKRAMIIIIHSIVKNLSTIFKLNNNTDQHFQFPQVLRTLSNYTSFSSRDQRK
ncbi:mucin-binding protein [Leuconostoc gasicomitatum]|nr:hypothetical protein [Leuconostoc gasicomitatum]CUW09634.1 hypothetical protein PB1E_1555 [Leuconostoc gasicomitatum]